MSSRCLYIYVYDERPNSPDNSEYWISQVDTYGGGFSPVIFLSNIKDDRPHLTDEDDLRSKYRFIQEPFHKFSIKDDREKLIEFRQTVMETVSNNVLWKNQYMTTYGYELKEKLHNHFKQNNKHMSNKDFQTIAKKCGIPADKVDFVLKELITLGICFQYKHLEHFGNYILNPEWAIQGIYNILDTARNDDQARYIIDVDYVLKILDEREIKEKKQNKYKFPYEDVDFLFYLMEHYQLAYFSYKDKQHICIPSISPLNSPSAEIPMFDDVANSNKLRMTFGTENTLPPDIMARLIIIRHTHNKSEVNENLLWRKGVVLKYAKDTVAIVMAERCRIIVDVYGSESTKYISIIRKTLYTIFDTYNSIEPEVRYKVLFEKTPKLLSKILKDRRSSDKLMYT